jgi:hypothetical protein
VSENKETISGDERKRFFKAMYISIIFEGSEYLWWWFRTTA